MSSIAGGHIDIFSLYSSFFSLVWSFNGFTLFIFISSPPSPTVPAPAFAHPSPAPQARYVQAKLSVHDRSLKVATVIESLEMEMELLCLTGVEDQLQADVRPTLEILRNAGIKVWGGRRPHSVQQQQTNKQEI